MFPDPTIKWRPYSSIMDGIKEPFALDHGLWKGVLHLIVFDAWPENRNRAYGVKIRTDAYVAIEEFIYSTASHGDRSGAYDGNVYVKEAIRSHALETIGKKNTPTKKCATSPLSVMTTVMKRFQSGNHLYERSTA